MKPATWKDDPRLAYLLVNLSTLFWASNIALGRALRGQVGPFTLTAFRFAAAGLVFALLISRLPPRNRSLGRDWWGLAAMGLTGVFTFPALLYLALQRTTAINASLINGLGPLITAMLAALLLSERLSMVRIVGTLVSLTGVGLVIGAQVLASLRLSTINQGDVLVLLDVFIWGIYSVLSRVLTRSHSALVVTAYSIWIAVPFLLGAAFFEWLSFPPLINLRTIAAGIYIALFPTCIAFLSWNEGVRRVGPARAMAFYNLLPVYGVLLGVVFLGEAPTWTQFAGGSLVILGALAALKP